MAEVLLPSSSSPERSCGREERGRVCVSVLAFVITPSFPESYRDSLHGVENIFHGSELEREMGRAPRSGATGYSRRILPDCVSSDEYGGCMGRNEVTLWLF